MQDRKPAPPIWVLPAPPERQRGLGRAEIVWAAVKVADEGGAEALTMRSVAAELGSPTPMSLYRYVHSKEGLIDLMLDEAAAEVTTPEQPSEQWRADLAELARSLWAMTKRHPWYAVLVHSRPPAGPNATRRQEFVLAVFDRLGHDLAAALSYYRLLDSYILGLALQQVEERKMWRDNEFTSVEQFREIAREWWQPKVAESTYPLVARLLQGFLESEVDAGPDEQADEQFELGLGCLLDGIAARL